MTGKRQSCSSVSGSCSVLALCLRISFSAVRAVIFAIHPFNILLKLSRSVHSNVLRFEKIFMKLSFTTMPAVSRSATYLNATPIRYPQSCLYMRSLSLSPMFCQSLDRTSTHSLSVPNFFRRFAFNLTGCQKLFFNDRNTPFGINATPELQMFRFIFLLFFL